MIRLPRARAGKRARAARAARIFCLEKDGKGRGEARVAKWHGRGGRAKYEDKNSLQTSSRPYIPPANVITVRVTPSPSLCDSRKIGSAVLGAKPLFHRVNGNGLERGPLLNARKSVHSRLF